MGWFGGNRGNVGIVKDRNAEAAFRKAGSIAPSECRSHDGYRRMIRSKPAVSGDMSMGSIHVMKR